MRVVELDGSAQVSGLRVAERPEPAVGSNDILVRIRAVALNYRDLMIVDGRYRTQGAAGFVPLSDAAGEVVAVGAEVTRFEVGARVMGVFYPRWQAGRMTRDAISDQPGSTRDGMLAELVRFTEVGLVEIPDGLSFEEASTLPCAGVTAWAALQEPWPVAPGHRVLTLGSGGVSVFALQFAKLAGAEVIVTTSSDEKAERLKQLGADHVVNYRTDRTWHKSVRKIVPGGVEHVIENGGIGSLAQSVQTCAVGGAVNLLGAMTDPADFDPAQLAWAFCDIRKQTVGNTADAQAMIRAVDSSGLRPVIDRVFEFDEIVCAFQRLDRQVHIGKIVVRVGD